MSNDAQSTGNWVEVATGAVCATVSLPHATDDHIQRLIASTGTFYEGELLEATDRWVGSGVRVVDVGANIGNHTLYWAMRGADVHSFEPNRQLTDVLLNNAKRNGVADRITIHNEALGATEARGTLVNETPGNLGAGHISLDDGDVAIRPLDSFNLKDLALIKIDVEGMELDVLQGATQTIRASRPVLIVETLEREQLKSLLEFTGALGYVDWQTFNDSPTQVFIPSEKIEPTELIRISSQAALARFDHGVAEREYRAAMNEVSLKYRAAMQQIADLRTTSKGHDDLVAALREQAKSEAARCVAAESAADLRRREAESVGRALVATAHELEAAREQGAELTRRLTELAVAEASAAGSAKRIEILEEDRASLETDLVQSREAARRAAEANKGLQDELAQLRNTHAALQTAFDAKSEELSSIGAARDLLAGEINTVRERLTSLNGEYSEVIEEITELRQERNEARDHLYVAQRELAGVREDLSSTVQELERAQEESVGKEHRVAELTASLADTSGRLAELEESWAVLSEDRATLTEQLAQLSALRDVTSTEADVVRAELQQLVAEKDNLSDELHRARTESQEIKLTAETERADASARLEHAQGRIAHLETRLERIAAVSDRRVRDLREFVEKVKEHERTIAGLHADKIRMAGRLRDVGRERNALRDQLAKTKESFTYRSGEALRDAMMNGTLVSLPSRLMKLRKEQQERERELAALRAAEDVSAPNEDVVAVAEHQQEEPAEAPQAEAQEMPEPERPKRVDGWTEPVRVEDAPMDMVRRPRSEVRVACILDEFSYACFSPEADFLQLTPEAWESELVDFQPQILFIESAWRGVEDRWRNMVGACAPEVLGIIEWCRDRGIPTVFWNKEDPVHFATFLNLASRFDIVLTTDLDCVPRYRQHLGHDRVHFFPFAAQPRIHNPIEEFERQDAFAFAGAYYAKYPDRTADLESFVDALPRAKDLVIFDRMFGLEDPNYAFPEEYKKYIVGRLEPEEISIAYKGYTTGINLNSVKQSQSMFARRVYELLASNTLVVSNYSPALDVMFGKLVLASDRGSQILTRLQELDDLGGGQERLRAQALRKVLREHTYEDRFATICSAAGVAFDSSLPTVHAVALADDQAALDSALEAIARQSVLPTSVSVISRNSAALRIPEGAVSRNRAELGKVTLQEIAAGASHLALIDGRDHYGEHYLEDLVLASRYLDAAVIAKAPQFVWNGALASNKVKRYVRAEAADLRRSLIDVSQVPNAHMRRFLTETAELPATWRRQLQIDGYEYVEGAAGVRSDRLEPSESTVVEEGTTYTRMAAVAQSAPLVGDESKADEFPMERFVALFDGVKSPLTISLDGKSATVVSELEPEKHTYMYATQAVELADLGWDETGCVFVEASPGFQLDLTIVFRDEVSRRITNVMASTNKNVRFEIPDEAAEVLFALRGRGPGELTLKRLMLSEHVEATAGILTEAKHLILTNIYPSYTDLYRNGFVHSRARAYREAGVAVDVVRLADIPSPQSREFEGVRVTDLRAEELRRMIEVNSIESVLVHFLDPAMWEVLRDPALGIKVHVWVHGSEVQPWWRREYNAMSDADLDKAKDASEKRMQFWRGVFDGLPNHVDFVFVSHYFAEEVFEDVGIRLPDDRYRIIHNPIDGDVFTYVPKPDEQRFKVLTIRPYASRKYANDLSVAAVLALQDDPNFHKMEFRFIGDGAMFDEILEPLRDFPNVTIERGFLTHPEIAAIHKEYGVCLTPTRMDAQGVSRDEAMSSGLVPVTSQVAAVPEFVDEQTGFLAPLDDYEGLARAISRLAAAPQMFQAMSAAAADRVRRQSGKAVILRRELELIEGEARDS